MHVRSATMIAGTVVWLAGLATAQMPEFQDVTGTCGLLGTGNTAACGVAVGDYDGDGWDDVLLYGQSGAGTRLFRNNGDKTFSDVTDSVLPPGMPAVSGAAFVDIDNDGDADLVLARQFGNFQVIGLEYLFNEQGQYVSGTGGLGLSPASGELGGMSIADIDLDGDLDVVIMRYFGTGSLFLNDGSGHFTDATAGAGGGLTMSRRHWSNALADFDNDGDPDMHVAIDFGPDYHLHNNGDGTFVDVSAAVGVTNVGADMGLAVGDVDNDGDLDIYSTNIGFGVLYINDGAGNFQDQAGQRGVRNWPSGLGIGWGASFADLNLDRYPDITFVTGNTRGGCFVNRGDATFDSVPAGNGLQLDGLGLVAFDYDHDGDIDLLTARCESVRLLENVTPRGSNRWLVVRPVGTQSNRSGIGTRVYALAAGVQMMQEIVCGASFRSSGPYEAHFGLSACPMADELTVIWPSGAGRRLSMVAADQRLTVREPVLNPDGTLVGDLDGDADVDTTDLVSLLSGYGSVTDTGDLNGDGYVGLFDLAMLLSQFGAFVQP